ncbi:MAG: c-type cytochrome, partial [Silicimonas sp.]|nr:c-type cytochrome [Silicimonas sp.]
MLKALSFALAVLAAPLAAQSLEEGAAAFAAHCAGCHGASAAGDGPTAALMSIAPADLTRLASDNGGMFPMVRVIEKIDGTADVAAHGGAMPMFGMLLQGPSVAIATEDG